MNIAAGIMCQVARPASRLGLSVMTANAVVMLSGMALFDVK